MIDGDYFECQPYQAVSHLNVALPISNNDTLGVCKNIVLSIVRFFKMNLIRYRSVTFLVHIIENPIITSSPH